MNVAVGVEVVAPAIVAALVNGNDAVAVINALNEHATCEVAADIAGTPHFRSSTLPAFDR